MCKVWLAGEIPSALCYNTRSESRLYDVEVIEDDPRAQKVKIHYIGYSSRYDKWRPLSDIVDKRNLLMNEDSCSQRLHVNLHQELNRTYQAQEKILQKLE